MGTNHRVRGFLANAALILLSLLVGLALCEALAWQISPPPRPALLRNMFEIGPGGVWRLTPNFHGVMDNRVDFRHGEVTADAAGQRIVPAAPATAPRRLLVIGDSQAFGHGLSDEESWPNRLQEDLNRRGQAVKVVNMAIPAINIDQYLARTKLIAPELKPGDTVLVALSWNDVITVPSQADSNHIVEGYLVSATAASGDPQATRARLRFYDFTGVVVPPLQDLKSFLDVLGESSALAGILYPRAKALYYRYRPHSPVDDLVKAGVPEANFLMMHQIQEMVTAKGARLVVALLPERMFFEDTAFAVYSVNGRDFPTQDYQAAITLPSCRRWGMVCLNAFPLLHEHQGEALTFRADGHFTPHAAALIGPWLAGEIFP